MSDRSKDEQKMSFEAALAELEATVEKLETGDLTLEDTLAFYERGQELAQLCDEALNDADLRLEALRPAAGGGYEVAPLDEDGR
jgi:exodeoxyribonuclease VII small subunit